MGAAVGTIGRVLVHHALAILAADLRDLLLRHLYLWRHAVSRHRLTVARIHGRAICGIRIVSRIVTRWTIALGHRISGWHVTRHSLRLRHASRGSKCDLCLACEVRPAFDLDNSFQAVLH